jgi:hypothetical protein
MAQEFPDATVRFDETYLKKLDSHEKVKDGHKDDFNTLRINDSGWVVLEYNWGRNCYPPHAIELVKEGDYPFSTD